MNWFFKFLTSSIGQKIVMSLTGLFLILFLTIHLAGNLQLLLNDEGEAFNMYAYDMAHNPAIQAVSKLLYLSILLHAIQGIALWLKNKGARTSRYAVKQTKTTGTNGFAAKNMAWLGILLFIFIVLHMGDFWYAMKFGDVDMVSYNGGEEVKDLYAKVAYSFKNPIIVAFYVLSMIGLAFHLLHGFQSAFQTVGVNHDKYTPLVRGVGSFFSIVVPLAFAIIPVVFYLMR